MRIAREEIFGPVLTVIPYRDEDEALAIANDSEYGLAGAVFTADTDRGLAIAGRVRAGSFGVNEGYIMDPLAPYGGVKASGYGRELGREGLDGYLVSQSISRAARHDAAKEQPHRELEVTFLLFGRPEHAEVGHPRGHRLDHRQEVLGRQFEVVDLDGPEFLVAP